MVTLLIYSYSLGKFLTTLYSKKHFSCMMVMLKKTLHFVPFHYAFFADIEPIALINHQTHANQEQF